MRSGFWLQFQAIGPFNSFNALKYNNTGILERKKIVYCIAILYSLLQIYHILMKWIVCYCHHLKSKIFCLKPLNDKIEGETKMFNCFALVSHKQLKFQCSIYVHCSYALCHCAKNFDELFILGAHKMIAQYQFTKCTQTQWLNVR